MCTLLQVSHYFLAQNTKKLNENTSNAKMEGLLEMLQTNIPIVVRKFLILSYVAVNTVPVQLKNVQIHIFSCWNDNAVKVM